MNRSGEIIKTSCGRAVVVKILLGLYTKKRGEKLESDALTAAWIDNLQRSISQKRILRIDHIIGVLKEKQQGYC